MSSSKKQIVIDPINFSGGTNNTTLKRQKKVKPPAALIRQSTLKQNLLKKIKEHQQRHEETPQQPQEQQGGASDSALANQFKMSTNYLEQLMARKQNKLATPKKPKTRTLPQPMMQQPQSQPMMQQMQSQMMQPQSQMMQPQSQMMQPMQPQSQMMQQPQTQMMQQPMMQEVSLELPPELQLNPMSMSIPMSIPMSMPSPMPMSMPSPMPMPIQEPATNQVSSDEPPVNKLAFKDVPYGCLRGGNKPTYRTYHRNQPLTQNQNHVHNTTLKKSLFSEIQSPLQQAELDPMIQERQRKLREIQMNSHAKQAATNQNAETNDPAVNDPAVNDHAANDPPNTMIPTKIKKEIKQTITKKYRLGKHASGKIVGVFIKNSDTRRKIQEEHGVLRRESIVEIRKYLHDHGLIKVGSDAPPDVLRNIYESAKMTGDVNNTNKHVMLHNFLKSDENTIDT
jgi:hypothetical protein